MKDSFVIEKHIEYINTIDSKFHRDLISLLYAPPVFMHFFPSVLKFNLIEDNCFENLRAFYESTKLIQPKAETKALRLGQYAEVLLQFYFDNSSNYKLLGKNIQLIDDKITKGEVDFLLQKDSLYIHLEVALKYYLKIEKAGEIYWIGPSAKDNLRNKQKKLLNHQLKLTENYHYLIPKNLKRTYTPKLLLKGAEFIPFQDYIRQSNCYINTWWLHFKNISQLKSSNIIYRIILNRKDWIFPFNTRYQTIPLEELEEKINELLSSKNEIMLCRFTSENIALDWGFIVRNNWPD